MDVQIILNVKNATDAATIIAALTKHEQHDLHHELAEIRRQLSQLLSQGERIMATQAELTTQVNTLGTKIDKIQGETAGLLVEIQDLKDAIANGPAVTPELQAAVDAVFAKADALDALVPDAVLAAAKKAAGKP